MNKVKLYVNGAFFKTVEIEGYRERIEMSILGSLRRFSGDIPSPKIDSHLIVFHVEESSSMREGFLRDYPGENHYYLGYCVDPAVYIDVITGELKCHKKEAIRRAAQNAGYVVC